MDETAAEEYQVKLAHERLAAMVPFLSKFPRFPPNVQIICMRLEYDDGQVLTCDAHRKEAPQTRMERILCQIERWCASRRHRNIK